MMFSNRIRAVSAAMLVLLVLTGCTQVAKNASSEPANVVSTVTSEPNSQSTEGLISREASDTISRDASDMISRDASDTVSRDASDTVSREIAETDGQNAEGVGDRDLPEKSSQATAENSPTSPAPEATPFVFNPHVYSCFLETCYSDDHREAFFNLCDALQEGGDTFVCASQEIYKFCMHQTVLNDLYPVASMQITGESQDGSEPYENGVGRIFYTKSKEDFMERQKNFQKEVTEIMNAYVRPDDSDFEKCLALYDYIVSTYEYDYLHEVDSSEDGSVCACMKYKKGVCRDLSPLYGYLLLQCGINAITVNGLGEPAGYHTWTFVDIKGKGYHVDTTWGLKADKSYRTFALDYFMMTDDDRAASGYMPDQMQTPILPTFYARDSGYNFVANDDSYRLPEGSYCRRYDRDRNVIYYCYYSTDTDEHMFTYE